MLQFGELRNGDGIKICFVKRRRRIVSYLARLKEGRCLLCLLLRDCSSGRNIGRVVTL